MLAVRRSQTTPYPRYRRPDRRFTEDPVRMIRAARFGYSRLSDNQATSIPSAETPSSRASQPSRMYESSKTFLLRYAKQVYHWLGKTDLIRPMFTHSTTGFKKIPLATTGLSKHSNKWTVGAKQLSIHPALLFALIFGEYHEMLISKIEQGSAL